MILLTFANNICNSIYRLTIFRAGTTAFFSYWVSDFFICTTFQENFFVIMQTTLPGRDSHNLPSRKVFYISPDTSLFICTNLCSERINLICSTRQPMPSLPHPSLPPTWNFCHTRVVLSYCIVYFYLYLFDLMFQTLLYKFYLFIQNIFEKYQIT